MESSGMSQESKDQVFDLEQAKQVARLVIRTGSDNREAIRVGRLLGSCEDHHATGKPPSNHGEAAAG
jgi:hypothetical protein